jgi:hypothetical protein
MADDTEGALRTLQAAQAAWRSAVERYASQLEAAKQEALRRWQSLPRNAGKSPDALRAALDRVGADGELAAEDEEAAWCILLEEFLVQRTALAAALEGARALHASAVATLEVQADAEAQALQARVAAQATAAQEAHVAALRRVFPGYEQVAASDALDDKLLNLASLLEHVALRLDALTSRLGGLEERVAPLLADHAAAAAQRVLDAAAQCALDERHPPVRYVTLRAPAHNECHLAVSQVVVTAVGLPYANVAQGTTATASGTHASCRGPTAVVDGNLGCRRFHHTFFATDGLAWLRVDLGSVYNVSCVTVIAAEGYGLTATLELHTELEAPAKITKELSEAPYGGVSPRATTYTLQFPL